MLKNLIYNVLLTVVICNSVVTTAFATNSKVGKARRSWAFHVERAPIEPQPRALEEDNSKAHVSGKTKNLTQSRNVVKSVAIATGLSLLVKNHSILKHALDAYETLLVDHPLQTKVLTGATLSLLGDGAAQTQEGRDYDMKRGLSFAAFDSCYRMFQHIAIPVIVRLGKGNVLSSILGLARVRVGINFLAAMERTLIYQFCLIPFFYYPVFFSFTGIIQGLSISETIARAKSTFLPCWIKNISFWIPTQLVMFGLVDDKWQVPFVCVMGIIWSSILSITAGKARVEGQNK